MAVLIADNDRAVSGLLTDVLKQSSLSILHAYDGDAAILMARDERVEVLVCDLDMPGASGLEVLESLRALPNPPRAIVISGYLDTKIEARLRSMPFVLEVLRKPFDLLVFAGVVRRISAMGEAQAAPDGPPSAASRAPHGPHVPGQKKTGEDAGDGPGNRGVAVEH